MKPVAVTVIAAEKPDSEGSQHRSSQRGSQVKPQVPPDHQQVARPAPTAMDAVEPPKEQQLELAPRSQSQVDDAPQERSRTKRQQRLDAIRKHPDRPAPEQRQGGSSSVATASTMTHSDASIVDAPPSLPQRHDSSTSTASNSNSTNALVGALQHNKVASSPSASSAVRTNSESRGSTPSLQPTEGPRIDPNRRRETRPARAATTDTTARIKLVQRVSRAFQHLGPDGGMVRLRLAPAELGSVRVEMRVNKQSIQARVVAETEAASATLREHLPDLRALAWNRTACRSKESMWKPNQREDSVPA